MWISLRHNASRFILCHKNCDSKQYIICNHGNYKQPHSQHGRERDPRHDRQGPRAQGPGQGRYQPLYRRARFQHPDCVKEAAKKAIDDNFTHYPPVPGYPDLREAVCKKFKRDNNLDFKPEQIVVSTGAKQSIYQLVQCLINPGDEVIIPTPSGSPIRKLCAWQKANASM